MPQSLRASLYNLRKYAEVLIAFAVVGVIAIIILPMPSFLLDLLLTVNLAISMMILILTLFTKSVLEFSIFPSLLLVMTMFRLGLNISSTRLILSKGDAGEVINAFATFVTGNNYVVGAVIFIIITIVQMVVVTNGAGRVSEVGARFTLDAKPGKAAAAQRSEGPLWSYSRVASSSGWISSTKARACADRNLPLRITMP